MTTLRISGESLKLYPTEGGERRRELDSPDERHHLLHDVLAEGDNDEELLQEETAASVLEQLNSA